MEFQVNEHDIFFRIDNGESVMSSIAELASLQSIHAAAIVSGVGMLSNVKLGFFELEKGSYTETEFEGIFDLNNVTGNVTRLGNEPYPHVHVVVNDSAHNTISGHLLEATCHITLELFLSKSALDISRNYLSGCPVPLITGRP